MHQLINCIRGTGSTTAIWESFQTSLNMEMPNNEDFRIVDALYDNDVLYVLGHDFGPSKSNLPTRVITWDGIEWKDITTSDVS